MPTLDEAILGGGSGAPLDNAIDNSSDRRRQSLIGAVGQNPDEYGQATQLSRATGVPAPVVSRNMQVVSNRASVDALDAAIIRGSAVDQSMQNPDFAKLSHDDVPNINEIEAVFNPRMSAGKVGGPAFVRQELPPQPQRGLANTYIGASTLSGMHSLLSAGANVLDTLNPFTLSEQDAATLFKDNPEKLREMRNESAAMFLSRFARGQQEAATANMQNLSPEAERDYGDLKYATTDTSKAAYLSPVKVAGDVINSLPTTAALMLSAYLTKGAATRTFDEAIAAGVTQQEARQLAIEAAAKKMATTGAISEGVIGYGQQKSQTRETAQKALTSEVESLPEYQQLLSNGYTPEAAIALLVAQTSEQAGVTSGAVDVLTNLVGGKFLGKIIGEGGKLVPRIGKGFATEGITEAVQSGGEQFGENVALQNINPNQSLSDGVLENVLQGLVVGGVTGGGFSGAFGGAHKAHEATQDAQALEALSQLSTASKLRPRDVQTFEQFVDAANKDGPVQDLYLDPRALHQAGVDPAALAAISPSAAAQMPAAIATGSDIVIPVSEYAGRIAGTELDPVLLQHLRTSEDGLSAAEAQTYLQTQQEQFRTEAAKVMNEKAADEKFQASAKAVETKLFDELKNTGRFTDDVNTAYSTLMRDFYVTTASRLGITPEEMFARYPLQVRAESVAADARMQQPTRTDQTDELTGLPLNSDGTVTVYHHTNAEAARQIQESGTLRAEAEPDVYVTTREQPDTGYGDTVVAVNVRPEQLQIDDEFPDGRRDFRLSVGRPGGSIRVNVANGKQSGYNQGQGAQNDNDLDFTRPRASADQPGRQADQNVHATVAGGDAREGWAESTRVRGTNGKPAVVYRGASRALTGADFERSALGVATGNPSSGLGVWFTPYRDEAGRYGEVENFFLDLRKPKVIRIEDLPGFDTVDEANAFSRELAAQGYDGIAVDARHVGGPIHFVAFTPDNVVYPPAPASLDMTQFFQGEYEQPQQPQGGNRGEISFSRDITSSPSVITLFKNADLSTFLHETGHFQLEVLANIASRPDAPQGMVDDMNAALNWFKPGMTLEQWNTMSLEEKRPYHEQFARGFEAYLFDGKAPNAELQSLFQRFRAWLINVYKSVHALNVDISPEIRGVFDRLLASEETIKAAEAARQYAPVFTTPEEMGGTPQEWADYQRLGVEASRDAQDELQKRSLKDMQWLTNARGRILKQLQRDAKEKRKAVEDEVRAEVQATPVYAARRFLKSGEMIAPDGEHIKVEKGAKLDTDALAEMYPDSMLARPDLEGLRGMTRKDGLPPDLVAEMFGYDSGDQLVREILNAEPEAELVEGLTDRRMLERYGDLTDPSVLARAADEAIHNEARARFVATEVKALSKATAPVRAMTKAAKAFAETMIARKQVKDIKPAQYAAAETRAAKNAEKALKSGDSTTAAAEKRSQLVQNYATRAAYDAVSEVEKGVRYLRKFDNEGTRKSIDSEYADQIDQLLERFDLRSGVSNKEAAKRASLMAWVESQREQGLEPDIPQELLDNAQRKPYREMTLEEFRGLVDTVKQIEHLGRLKQKLLTAKDEREFAAVTTEISTSIDENANGRTAETRTPTDALGKLAKSLRRFWASHIKAATWSRVMDGGKDGGPMWEYFIRSANEKGDMETEMRAQATKALSAILGPVVKKWPKMQMKGRYFESVGRPFTREGAMTVALNTGNAGNLQRLLGGEGWTAAQIRPILESLTAEEWRAVQAIWDHFDSYRPQIGEKEKRIYGKAPDWVEPTPFAVRTADGQELELKGGYYPIKYDPAASQRAEEHADAEQAKRDMRGAYTAATTRRSFTKQRSEEVSGRPLLYSLVGVYSGVNDVIHDLSWHEWLIDANRLLRSRNIDQAIRGHYGPEVKDQFKQWVKDVAQGETRADHPAEVGVSWLRQSVSAAGLGFNVMSAVMQVTGFSSSIVRVGPGYIARGIAQYTASPLATTREVIGKSSFMEARSRTQFRELNELRNQVEGQSKAGRALTLGTYFMMMRAQRMVDVPTWLGAYEKAIADGNNEERSIALADQAVIDSQGSGMVKDLSTVERGGQALKLFTVFYSYMNTTLNVGVEAAMTERSKAKLAAKMLMTFTVPAVLGAVLKSALTPGGGGDDDEEGFIRKLVAEQISYLTGLMVGVREFSEIGKIMAGAEGAREYAGPAGVRVVSDVVKMGQQAQQGEFDDAFRKAAINVLGDLTGLPSAQINRTINGLEALDEGRTDNPAAVVLGYQR